MEKNTIICDVCDEHVAKCKCEICSKDICEDCTEEIPLFLSETLLFNINTCEKCQKQFSRVCSSEETIFEDVMKDKPEIKNEIVEIIKNVMMLHKISAEDIKKEEEIITTPFPYKLPKPFPYKPYPPLKPYKPYPKPPNAEVGKKALDKFLIRIFRVFII
jgi:hypothetical protein